MNVPFQRMTGPLTASPKVRLPPCAPKTVIAHTDASIKKHRGGVGLVFRTDDDGYASKTVFGATASETIDINRLELSAIFLALETAEEPITVNALCPGWVRTELVERQIEALAKEHKVSVTEAARSLLTEKQPSKVRARR